VTRVLVGLFVLTRLYILFGLQPLASDVSVYFSNTVRALELGETPYTHCLPIEFPPLAWWTMAAPTMVGGGHASAALDPPAIARARQAYTRVFRGLMCACDVVAFGLFVLIAQRRRPEFAAPAIAVYVLSTAALGHVLYDRLDAGLLMLLLAAAYSWVRSMDRPERSLGWVAAAYAAMGLGVAYKIIPILGLPFLMLADLGPVSRWRVLVVAAASASIALAVPFAVQYVSSGPGVFDLVAFHASRGIQLESLYATFMAIGQLFGSRIGISLWTGGANLSGPLAPAMQLASTIAIAVFLGGLALWSVCCLGRYDRCRAYRTMCFAFAGTVILSKVLSPQYFIWAVPLVLLLMLEVLESRRSFWLTASALVGVVALTTWVFPYHYFNFDAMPLGLAPRDSSLSLAGSEATFVLLGLRNFTYAGIVAFLGVRLVRLPGSRLASWRPPWLRSGAHARA
jgi:hypothetical protein